MFVGDACICLSDEVCHQEESVIICPPSVTVAVIVYSTCMFSIQLQLNPPYVCNFDNFGYFGCICVFPF